MSVFACASFLCVSALSVQRMYRGRLRSGRGVFVKKVPARVWREQWRQQQRFQGQFVSDGENYVGEAAMAAFLTRQTQHKLTATQRPANVVASIVPVTVTICRNHGNTKNTNISAGNYESRQCEG